MSPHYDRHSAVSGTSIAQREFGGADDAMIDAAEALRQAEVESVQPEVASTDSTNLDKMSIDELRTVAAALDVPNRGAITERDQLIAAIRQRQ